MTKTERFKYSKVKDNSMRYKILILPNALERKDFYDLVNFHKTLDFADLIFLRNKAHTRKDKQEQKIRLKSLDLIGYLQGHDEEILEFEQMKKKFENRYYGKEIESRDDINEIGD